MKIDKKKLIELLVRKTGMDSTEVEDQLGQLIRRIIDAAERGKALEIKEFGLFYFDENGDLKFDPSKELSTEINFKYAGMEPVELKPPRDSAADPEEAGGDPFAVHSTSEADKDEEPEPEPELEEDEEDLSSIFGFDEAAAEKQAEEDLDDDDEEIELPWGRLTDEQETVDTDPEKADFDDEDEYDDEIPEREEDPFAGLLGDASSKMSDSEKGFFEVDEDEPDHPLISGKGGSKPAGKKTPEKKKQAFEPKPEPEAKKKKTPDPKPKEPARPAVAAKKKESFTAAPSTKKAAPRPVERKSGRDPIMVVMGVVLVFIIVAAGFLIIPGLFEDQEPGSNVNIPETEQPVAESSQNEGAQPESADDSPDEGSLETIENPDRINVPEPEPETAVTDVTGSDAATNAQEVQGGYGLRGSLNEAANDGFSIVVHSLRQEGNARARAAELSSDGYRVLVSQRTVNGQNVWRVSVGQFETIADAQEAAQTLPTPYNSNNFIQRIQTN